MGGYPAITWILIAGAVLRVLLLFLRHRPVHVEPPRQIPIPHPWEVTSAVHAAPSGEPQHQDA